MSMKRSIRVDMKVFFDASLAGCAEFGPNYQKIYDAMVKSGMEVVSAPVIERSLKEFVGMSAEEANQFYADVVKWIKKADVCVYEVSYPSTSVGHELTMALQMGTPVVALHVKGTQPNRIMEGIHDEKFQLLEYKPEGVAKLVKDAVEYAGEQMDTRFNFFISPRIGNFLDWIAKEKKVPRAVFLRQLIERDMKEQEDYKG